MIPDALSRLGRRIAPFAAGLLLLTTLPDQAIAARHSFAEFDRQAAAGESLQVVFWGGPFTRAAGITNSWRERFQEHLSQLYPRAAFHFTVVDNGVAGSKLAMFRLESVLRLQPDLVFLDFLIDDDILGDDRETLAAYETILNRLTVEQIPIMQVLSGVRSVQGNFWKPVAPQRLRDYLEFGSLYRTGRGESHQRLHEMIEAHAFTLEEVWPADAVYPTGIGHDLIFAALRDGFQNAVAEKRAGLPPTDTVFARIFKSRQEINVAQYLLPAGWEVSSTELPPDSPGQPAEAPAVAAWTPAAAKAARPLRLDFTGTFIGLTGEASINSLEFKVVLDGKPLRPTVRPGKKRPDTWSTSRLSFTGAPTVFWLELASHIPAGRHSLEILPVPSAEGGSGQLRITSYCVAGD